MAFTPSRNRIAQGAAELEVTYGTDPVIDGATDGFLMIDSDVGYAPEIQRQEFRPHSASFTRQQDVIGIRLATFNFIFLLQGSGTAGTAVQGINDVLTCCGLTETVVAMTSVTYAPSTIATLKSASIWFNRNGVTHEGNGCYGNLRMEATSGAPTRCTFTGLGLYVAPLMEAGITSWSVGTTGVNRAKPNLSIGLSINSTVAGNWTAGPTVMGYTMDLGSDIRRIPDANSSTGLKALLFADRNPTATIDLVQDTDTSGTIITVAEQYTDILAATNWDVDFAINGGAGNINTFNLPTAQPVNIVPQSGDGFGINRVELKLQHATAESEYTVAQT